MCAIKWWFNSLLLNKPTGSISISQDCSENHHHLYLQSLAVSSRWGSSMVLGEWYAPQHDKVGNNILLSEENHHMWCYLQKRSINLWSKYHQIIRGSIWQSSEVFFKRRCCHWKIATSFPIMPERNSKHLEDCASKLGALQVFELNVHLQLCCLCYLERLKGKEDHPLSDYILKQRENQNLHHGKTISKPKTWTALMDNNLLYKFS